MKAALPFFLVAGGELWIATLLPAWVGWFAAWAGLSTGWLAVAYLVNRPHLLGKGRPWRHAFWPMLTFAQQVARAGQRLGIEPRQEIVPGLWVGGWPDAGTTHLALLDLTAELPQVTTAPAYRAFPTLDGRAPTPEDWRAAVDQVLAWRSAGLPVLVHCAYGHGRSVCVLLGVLLAEGWDPTPEAALARVQAIRPRARPSRGQWARVVAEAGRRPPG